MTSGGSDLGVKPLARAPNAMRMNSSLAMAVCCAHKVKKDLALLGGVERRSGRLGFNLGRLRFDQLHDVLDHVGILHMVIGDSGQIDHVLALTAAGAPHPGKALAESRADAQTGPVKMVTVPAQRRDPRAPQSPPQALPPSP